LLSLLIKLKRVRINSEEILVNHEAVNNTYKVFCVWQYWKYIQSIFVFVLFCLSNNLLLFLLKTAGAIPEWGFPYSTSSVIWCASSACDQTLLTGFIIVVIVLNRLIFHSLYSSLILSLAHYIFLPIHVLTFSLLLYAYTIAM